MRRSAGSPPRSRRSRQALEDALDAFDWRGAASAVKRKEEEQGRCACRRPSRRTVPLLAVLAVALVLSGRAALTLVAGTPN